LMTGAEWNEANAAQAPIQPWCASPEIARTAALGSASSPPLGTSRRPGPSVEPGRPSSVAHASASQPAACGSGPGSASPISASAHAGATSSCSERGAAPLPRQDVALRALGRGRVGGRTARKTGGKERGSSRRGGSERDARDQRHGGHRRDEQRDVTQPDAERLVLARDAREHRGGAGAQVGDRQRREVFDVAARAAAAPAPTHARSPRAARARAGKTKQRERERRGERGEAEREVRERARDELSGQERVLRDDGRRAERAGGKGTRPGPRGAPPPRRMRSRRGRRESRGSGTNAGASAWTRARRAAPRRARGASTTRASGARGRRIPSVRPAAERGENAAANGPRNGPMGRPGLQVLRLGVAENLHEGLPAIRRHGARRAPCPP
jgi:hypothetical protein